MTDNIRYVTPKVENPEVRRDLLERIVASYISGVHHDDVIPDDCDKVYASRLLDYLDQMLEEEDLETDD